MVASAAIGCFLGPTLYWLMSTLEVVQTLLFAGSVYLIYSFEQANDLVEYKPVRED
jgi:hypothetical protein